MARSGGSKRWIVGGWMFYSFNISYFFKTSHTGILGILHNNWWFSIFFAWISHFVGRVLDIFKNLWFFAAILAQVSESIGLLGERAGAAPRVRLLNPGPFCTAVRGSVSQMSNRIVVERIRIVYCSDSRSGIIIKWVCNPFYTWLSGRMLDLSKRVMKWEGKL